MRRFHLIPQDTVEINMITRSSSPPACHLPVKRLGFSRYMTGQ